MQAAAQVRDFTWQQDVTCHLAGHHPMYVKVALSTPTLSRFGTSQPKAMAPQPWWACDLSGKTSFRSPVPLRLRKRRKGPRCDRGPRLRRSHVLDDATDSLSTLDQTRSPEKPDKKVGTFS